MGNGEPWNVLYYPQMKDFGATLISLTSSTLKGQTLEGRDHWDIFSIYCCSFKVGSSSSTHPVCWYLCLVFRRELMNSKGSCCSGGMTTSELWGQTDSERRNVEYLKNHYHDWIARERINSDFRIITVAYNSIYCTIISWQLVSVLVGSFLYGTELVNLMPYKKGPINTDNL